MQVPGGIMRHLFKLLLCGKDVAVSLCEDLLKGKQAVHKCLCSWIFTAHCWHRNTRSLLYWQLHVLTSQDVEGGISGAGLYAGSVAQQYCGDFPVPFSSGGCHLGQ